MTSAAYLPPTARVPGDDWTLSFLAYTQFNVDGTPVVDSQLSLVGGYTAEGYVVPYPARWNQRFNDPTRPIPLFGAPTTGVGSVSANGLFTIKFTSNQTSRFPFQDEAASRPYLLLFGDLINISTGEKRTYAVQPIYTRFRV